MSDAKIQTGKKSFFNDHLKGTLINLTIVILAFASAIGLFAAYRNYETQREKDSIIPRAKLAYDRGDYSQSINLFQTAESYFPENLEVKKYLAELSFNKGKFGEAKKYLEEIKAKQNLDLDQISFLGNSYLELSEISDSDYEKQAIELWTSTTQIKPEDRYKLAKIYFKNKENEKYLTELAKIVEFKEPLIYLQVNESNLAAALSNIDKAQTAKALSPEEIDIELLRSQITEAKKQFDFNKKDFSELIRLAAFANIGQCQIIDPKIDTLRTSLSNQKIPVYQVDFLDAKCLNEESKADEAIVLIQKAIEQEKSNLEYREELAKSYFVKKDYENLKKTFDDIFVIKKTADLYKNYAAYLYKLDKKTESLAAYESGFELAEDPTQQEDIATIILQVEFLDNKNLEICSKENIVNALTYTTENTYLLKSICDVAKGREINTENTSLNINIDFIKALKSKDLVALEKALDRDKNAYMTNYYNAVGVKLMQ